MNNINILDSSIFNRIAAGEVVERPYSVVKELLDNSIDAKADKIEICIENGGITEIKISDNGTGIEKEDFSRVFLPHATSKIKTIADLDSICTLGFRGEALASISAVAKVKLQSKTENQELGKEMLICGGVTEYETEIGFNKGTTIIVNDIFFNVPARAKFLRKPRQETSDITNLIARYILANPNVSFRYVADGKEVYFSSGNGLDDAIFVVYGKDCLNNLVKVNKDSSTGINVSGFIGNTTYSKPNRTYQTLIINGRYVVNSMVSMCVYNCYEHYLMKGQFPFYVLNLNIPVEKLDVNVHPNKLDVRFENSNEIYGVVYSAVAETLASTNVINEISKPIFDYKTTESGASFSDRLNNVKLPQVVIVGENSQKDEYVEFKPNNEAVSLVKSFEEQKSLNNEEIVNDETKSIQSEKEEQTKTEMLKDSATNFFTSLSSISSSDGQLHTNSTILSNVYDKIRENQNNVFNIDNAVENKQQKMFTHSIKFVGTLFNTYLLVENESRVYIIDQHAAHERLLFDKLTSQVNNSDVSMQMLLVPHIITTNAVEETFILDNKDNFKKFGFEIEHFGNSAFKISTIPTILKDANIEKVINGMLSELSMFKTTKQTDLILNKLMQSACKHAVKAGDVLSEDSVINLLEQMKQEQMLLQCPHGRPVIVELTKTELEKWFKRIV